MKNFIRKSVRLTGSFIPDSFLHRMVGKNKVLGINYHLVSDKQVGYVRHLYSYKSPREFEKDIQYLKEHFNLLTYADVLNKRYCGELFDRPSVILTFDDGLSECYSVVRPVLLKYEVPCIFFITTDFIDNKSMFYHHIVSLCIDRMHELSGIIQSEKLRAVDGIVRSEVRDIDGFIEIMKSLRMGEYEIITEICSVLDLKIEEYLSENKPYLTESEIKDLANDGFTIGAHSLTHRKLTECSEKDIETEIVESCKQIGAITGGKSIPFAFPYNSSGSIDKHFLQELKNKYDIIGLFFRGGDLKKDSDIMIGRITADKPYQLNSNRSGLQRLIRRAYRNEYNSLCNEILQ